MKLLRRIRDLPMVVLRDLPDYRRALAKSGTAYQNHPDGWISVCNRIESLVPANDGPGVRCDWIWGSALHAAEVMPWLGREIFRVAESEWPIRFASQPRECHETPKVTFIFAHGGNERLPQLRRTLQSIHAQEGVACECIVVDQSPIPAVARLPGPVTYRHLSKDGVAKGWHKAWAYNVGARLARGSILIFHDGDICVPARYATEVVRAIDGRGYGAASLQRFLFYLSAADTEQVYRDMALSGAAIPSSVFQNWKGGTIAIERNAFFRIGGFDEGFVDWGGEDDEFYDRCAEVGHCRAGYLPFVHLWHPPQALRHASDNINTGRVLPARLATPRVDRVAELARRAWGNPRMPDPAASYASILASETKEDLFMLPAADLMESHD